MSVSFIDSVQTQDDWNAIELLFQLFLMVWSFVFVSLFCELGEMTLERYEKVDQQLFNCKWYKFPIEIQRMLVIVIANSQQPVTICGYGNIVCTRDALKKVNENSRGPPASEMIFIWTFVW